MYEFLSLSLSLLVSVDSSMVLVPSSHGQGKQFCSHSTNDTWKDDIQIKRSRFLTCIHAFLQVDTPSCGHF
ncbi:hypothetical protein PAXRUDRAFT_572800 [Paxillus rubicundulus Ve08.2h10]|uniref:Secreted protein n=1 Tax=Paxillus rubicundulus Ve08.2h10 TaxID=930991 RepID=A0A0D0DU86_9AGAM|nr:hypothetical protein PAXRUDRAFT_572800 [Paxillus rubicundulus Ve08.2h10]